MGLGRWLAGLSASHITGRLIPHLHKSLRGSKVCLTLTSAQGGVGGETAGLWSPLASQASCIGESLVQLRGPVSNKAEGG